MSKLLTFELSDEVYAALEEMARTKGQPLDELVLEWLVQHRPAPRRKRTRKEQQDSRRRLLRYAGRASAGRAFGTDNVAIDADLAREYGGDRQRPA